MNKHVRQESTVENRMVKVEGLAVFHKDRGGAP